MRIALSSEEFNPVGHVWIDADPKSLRDEWSRRVIRRATLDGGVSVVDQGFTHGDRTITVEWIPQDQQQVDRVRDLMVDYGRVVVALPDGVYLAAIESIVPGSESTRVRVLLLEKKSL